MKKALYFIAAISLAATSAMASKARQTALSNTTAITDIQGIFVNPADMHYVGDFATFEMGETPTTTAAGLTTGATPDAEGGFMRTMGDAKLGFYLGKTSANVNNLRDSVNTITSAGFLNHENPVEVFYGAKAGDQNWGLSFSYSNSDKKMDPSITTDDKKSTAMGMRLGVKNDVWGAYANIGLANTAKVGNSEFKGKSGLTLGGHYLMDTMKFIVKQEMAGAKADNGTADTFDYDMSETTLGFTNAWKSEGSIAFYGLAYKMKAEKMKVPADKKTDTTSMPFTIGAEVLATSWMKLRGSVTQNVLMSKKKIATSPAAGTDRDDTLDHNTTTAAGAGFVWGKNNLDVVMTAGTSGTLDTTAFGTQASYTYMF